MSADDGLVVQRKLNGKLVVQHFFMSTDKYPNPDDETTEYDLIEDAVLANAERARETEYGFFFNTISLREDNDV